MKKTNIYMSLVLFMLVIPLYAQQNKKAKTILDKTASVIKSSKGIQADFELIYSSKGNLRPEKLKGSLQMKGNCFILNTQNTITWFDGKTQWSYLLATEEVNISTPSAEELRNINPYYILGIYDKGYTCIYNGIKNFKGKAGYEIVLNAKNSSHDPQKVTLIISQAYEPLYIKTVQKDKSQSEITITTYRTSMNFPNNLFKFDKKKYPNAEIIDLR